MPKGTVISSASGEGVPIGGDVLPGSEITLVVSAGPQPRTAPQLRGLSQDDATQVLTDIGLTIAVGDPVFDNDVAVDEVAAQSPAAGQPVPRGGHDHHPPVEGPGLRRHARSHRHAAGDGTGDASTRRTRRRAGPRVDHRDVLRRVDRWRPGAAGRPGDPGLDRQPDRPVGRDRTAPQRGVDTDRGQSLRFRGDGCTRRADRDRHRRGARPRTRVRPASRRRGGHRRGERRGRRRGRVDVDGECRPRRRRHRGRRDRGARWTGVGQRRRRVDLGRRRVPRGVDGRRPRWSRRPRQQRRHPPRPADRQHDRGRVGRRRPRAPQGPLRPDAARGGASGAPSTRPTAGGRVGSSTPRRRRV